MAPISLPPDTIDDLIYSARIGDLAALQEDISAASTNSSSSQAVVIASAVDSVPEAEGGSGSCLLHFPAANGNIEILNYLLQTLQKDQDQDQTLVQNIVNHRNHSGNTPLHWAALNTHLDCVKALVEAGADVSIKNDAGLDAVFLAERTAWSTGEVKEDDGDEEAEAQAGGEGEGEESNAGPMSKGRQVAEWLLSSDKGGELESGVAGNEGQDASGSEQK